MITDVETALRCLNVLKTVHKFSKEEPRFKQDVEDSLKLIKAALKATPTNTDGE